MLARIYKPTKTAMQSGLGNTRRWVLEFEPEAARQVEPLMGWTSSTDTKQQLRLYFETKEEAVAYCKEHGIAHTVEEPRTRPHQKKAYADNFAFDREEPWTH